MNGVSEKEQKHSSHLTFSWNWETCSDETSCRKIVHLAEDSAVLNSYPQEWTRSLIKGVITVEDDVIIFRDSINRLHREDGPAVQDADGNIEWWFEGNLHRVDGPAKEYADGSEAWYFNGKLHRVDGPASTYANGDMLWFRHGVLHREDGPAIKYVDGSEKWYLNGKQHRVGGPAVINSFGTEEWWVNGKNIY